jgi:release factor glutamine methyltransferase
MSTNNPTIGDLILKTAPFLAGKGIPNPRLEADLLLADVLNLPRIKLYSQWDRPLEPFEVSKYREVIVKRVQGWPLAYLTGKKSFLSWEFQVNPSVLIPRPETELLVEAVCDWAKNREIVGADAGTGSGVIAIALAKLLPQSTWYATDISPAALAVADTNAKNLGVDSRLRLVEGDWLEPLLASSVKLDIVVSNPPYIPSSEIASLQPEVRKEPVLALDGGDDGLDYYRRLFPQATQLLNDGGLIAVEHGHNQRRPLEELLTGLGFTCRGINDLARLERVLIGDFHA